MHSSYSYRVPLVAGMVSLVVLLSLSSLVQAETKTIMSEATYSMGDGETPSLAEAMVLQKAKQRALEEAGTYVESYTHVRNLDLTVDEIKTIAGGVMKTEIVEQNRALEGNGTRFYIKIRAVVTTDKIEDLASRKQLGPLAAENKRLQDDVAKLTRDLEGLKLQIFQVKTEPERKVVLEKIKDVEEQFRQVRSTETTLYRRLVSGEELSAQVDKALREQQRQRDAEQRQRERQRESLERVIGTLKNNGHTISIGSPEAEVSLDHPDIVSLRFLVTAEASNAAKYVLHDLHKAYKSELDDVAARQIDEVLGHLTLVLTVSLQDGQEYLSSPEHIHNYKSPLSYDLNQIVKNEPTVISVTVSIPRSVVAQVASVEGKIEANEAPVIQTHRAIKPRPSLTDELNRELDKELNKIRRPELSREPRGANTDSQQAPRVKVVDTRLNIPGMPSRFNVYLAQVRQKVSSMWSAPPVDVTAQVYSVVVKFRLHRDGSVSGVAVEQSSGNEYFDLDPLPMFPADLTESYFYAHFTFTVGE